MSDIIVIGHLNDLWKDKYVNLNGYTWCDANNTKKKPYGLNIYKHIFVDLNSIRRIPGIHKNGTEMSDQKCLTIEQ